MRCGYGWVQPFFSNDHQLVRPEPSGGGEGKMGRLGVENGGDPNPGGGVWFDDDEGNKGRWHAVVD